MSYKAGDRVRRTFLDEQLTNFGFYPPVGTLGTVLRASVGRRFVVHVAWDGGWKDMLGGFPDGEPCADHEIELVPQDIRGDGPVIGSGGDIYEQAAWPDNGFLASEREILTRSDAEALCDDPSCAMCANQIVEQAVGSEGAGVITQRAQEQELIIPGPVSLSDSDYRKMLPVGTVVTEYWPNAMKAAAAVAWVGNEKHNPGERLHWAEDKSKDHEDCLARHRIDAKSGDGWDTVELPDGRTYQVRHAAAAAWRALCLAEQDARTVDRVVRRLK